MERIVIEYNYLTTGLQMILCYLHVCGVERWDYANGKNLKFDILSILFCKILSADNPEGFFPQEVERWERKSKIDFLSILFLDQADPRPRRSRF